MTTPAPTAALTTDFSDWTDSLRRVVATAGTFSDVFPNTTDDDLVGSMLDGIAESQLDGFFTNPLYSYTQDGIVTPALTPSQVALVVIYAGCRLIRAELLNRQVSAKYQAGPVSYETAQASNVLSQILKDLTTRRDELVTRALTTGAGTAFVMADGYLIKALGYTAYQPLGFDGADIDRAYDYHDPFGTI